MGEPVFVRHSVYRLSIGNDSLIGLKFEKKDRVNFSHHFVDEKTSDKKKNVHKRVYIYKTRDARRHTARRYASAIVGELVKS